jgi:hypothetical protein
MNFRLFNIIFSSVTFAMSLIGFVWLIVFARAITDPEIQTPFTMAAVVWAALTVYALRWCVQAIGGK